MRSEVVDLAQERALDEHGDGGVQIGHTLHSPLHRAVHGVARHYDLVPTSAPRPNVLREGRRRIGAHQTEGHLRVLDGVPTDGERPFDRSDLDGYLEGALGVVADVQDPGETSDETGQLVAPVGHRLQIAAGPEPWLNLRFERNQTPASGVGKRNRPRDQFPLIVESLGDLGDRAHDTPVLGSGSVGDRCGVRLPSPLAKNDPLLLSRSSPY